jgi:hypothetical protein
VIGVVVDAAATHERARGQGAWDQRPEDGMGEFDPIVFRARGACRRLSQLRVVR